MKKNLTRILAMVLALLMCMSLLPLSALAMDDFAAMYAAANAAMASAMGGAPDAESGEMYFPADYMYASDYTDPNVCPASDDGMHLFMEIIKPEYLCEAGDCTEEVPHILYKSCAHCKQSAEWLYMAEMEAVQNEVMSMNDEDRAALMDDPDALADLEYRYKQYIFEVPDHLYVKVEGQAPTCTMGGVSDYEECAVCGEIRGYEELDPLGHDWGEYVTITEPACTAKGSQKHVCERCGVEEYADIPALGHDWGEFVVVKEPTCTETGTTKRVCERCDAEDFGEIPAKGHSYGDFTVIKEATCTEDGSKQHTCAVCEYTETVVIPAAHTWGEYSVVTEPTCTEDGLKTRVCTVCGAEEEAAIPAAHKYEDGVCTVCGEAEPKDVKEETTEPVEETKEPVEQPKVEEHIVEEPAGAQTAGAIVDDCRDMYASFGAYLSEQGVADANYVVASYTPIDANGQALSAVPEGGVRFALPLPEGCGAESVQIYTYDYSTYSWSPAANFTRSGDEVTVTGGAYPFPPFAVCAAQSAAGNETTPTKQEAVSEGTVNEFKSILTEKGLSNGTGEIVAQHVTPLREDGTEMTNAEVAERGGIIFEMDLPESYKEGDTLNIGHRNSETGEWEIVTDYEIKGNKVIIYATHFSDWVIEVEKKSESGVINDEPVKYAANITVKLEPNGGTGEQMASITGAEGNEVTLPSKAELTYERNGYNFAGWNTEPDGTGTSYGSVNNPYGATYTIHDGETLYAIWAKKVTLTYNINGGTLTDQTKQTLLTKTYSMGATVTLLTAEELTLIRKFSDTRNYKFTGWNQSKSGTSEDTTHFEAGGSYPIVGDETLYAEWAKPVTISYKGNGATDGYMADDTTHFVGDEITLAPNQYKRTVDGVKYFFTEWNTTASGGGIPYEDEEEKVYLSDDLKLYAQWAEEITVKFFANGDDVKRNDTPVSSDFWYEQQIPAGYYTKLDPVEYKRDRFAFTGWNTKEDGTGAAYADKDDVLFIESMSLYAQWEQNEFHVSFYDGEEHLDPDKVKDKDVEKGGTVEMPDYSPAAGHDDQVLIGWTLTEGSSKVDCKVGKGYQPTKDVKFYAVFAEAVTVTFYGNQQGSGEPKTQKIPRGVATELTAFNKLNFSIGDQHFKQWRDQPNAEGATTLQGKVYSDRQSVTLTANLTLYAQLDAGELIPAPAGIAVSRHMVNYGNTVLHGHPATVTGVNDSMEFYGSGKWNNVSGDTQSFGTPGTYEFRYKDPVSESTEKEIKSYVSKASAPKDVSTDDETIYRYDVSIYEKAKSGEETKLDSFPPVGFPEEEIYFLLSYPEGLSKDSHKLTLKHVPDDGKEIEIEQLDSGILGSSTSFSDFDLYVEDKLHGNVILSPSAPKAGETIRASITDDNNKGTLEYRWLRDGSPINSWSKSNAYTVQSADLKHKLSCEVRSSNPANGTITSSETSTIPITQTEITDPSSSIIGYFDGVVEGMQYKIGDGVWKDVPGSGTLSGNRLYVTEPGEYTFRNKNESKEQYWYTGTLDRWYLIGFTSTNSTSTTTSSSGTSTTTSGSGQTYMYMIPDSSTTGTGTRLTTATSTEYVKYYGSGNMWKVKQGSPVRFYIDMKPSSGSYVHYNRNNSGYATGTTSEVTIYLGSGNNGYVDKNDYFDVVYNRSSTSPKTGDESHLGLWSALCFTSLAGAGVLLNGERKRRKARR